MTSLHGQLARYLVVGASNTAITLIVYWLALRAGAQYLVAFPPAFALGAINGYTLNRLWTFRGVAAFGGGDLARYVTVQLTGMGLNALLLVALVEGLGAEHLAAQAVALCLVSLATFVASRWWVFRER